MALPVIEYLRGNPLRRGDEDTSAGWIATNYWTIRNPFRTMAQSFGANPRHGISAHGCASFGFHPCDYRDVANSGAPPHRFACAQKLDRWRIAIGPFLSATRAAAGNRRMWRMSSRTRKPALAGLGIDTPNGFADPHPVQTAVIKIKRYAKKHGGSA
jgi:hypothetical protein